MAYYRAFGVYGFRVRGFTIGSKGFELPCRSDFGEYNGDTKISRGVQKPRDRVQTFGVLGFRVLVC